MPGIIFRDRLEIWKPDKLFFHRRIGGKTKEGRPTCEAALAKADRTAQSRDKLESPHRCLEGLKELRADGYEISEQAEKIAFHTFPHHGGTMGDVTLRQINETRHNIVEDVTRQMLHRLATEVAPPLQAGARAVAAELRADAKEIDDVTVRVGKKYGYDRARSELAAGLEAMADEFEAMAVPLPDLSYGGSPRAALNANFEKPLR